MSREDDEFPPKEFFEQIEREHRDRLRERHIALYALAKRMVDVIESQMSWDTSEMQSQDPTEVCACTICTKARILVSEWRQFRGLERKP